MARYKKIPFKDVATVYEKKGANVTATCVALKIDRNTLTSWRQKYKELDTMMTDVEEGLIDFAESKLIENINDGILTAIIFYLKTKGKKRGYTEGEEVEVKQTSDLDLSGLSDEELALLGKLLKKTKRQ